LWGIYDAEHQIPISTPLPSCKGLFRAHPPIETGTSFSQFPTFFPTRPSTQHKHSSCWALPDIGFIHRQPILNCQYWFIRRMRRCHMGYEKPS